MKATGDMVSKIAGKLIAALAVTCLAACSGGGRGSESFSRPVPTDNYKLSAEAKDAVLVLEQVNQQRIAHDPALAARVGAFTHDFVNRSSSTMQVLVGAGNVDDATATEIAREAVRVLARHGVPSSRMDIKVISGNSNIKPGTVVMRYTQWAAVLPECAGMSSNVAVDYSNGNTPNLGCSIQRNIAAMIADPRDLNQPATMEMREGGPGEAVMRKFRRGEETKSFEWKEVQFGQ